THETSPTGAQRRRSAAHWFGDKANFTDTGPLTSLDNTSDTFVSGGHITANVHFRLRNLHGDGLQLFKQRIDIRYLKLVPVHRAVFGDGDHDVFRLGLCRYVARLGQLHRNGLNNDGNRDQEDDQHHQHDIHEGCRVDGGVEVVVTTSGNVHPHGYLPAFFSSATRIPTIR